MSFSSWSTTPSSNASTLGIDIGEGCAAANVNDAIRTVMAQIRAAIAADLDTFLAGGAPLPVAYGGTGTTTAAVAIPVGTVINVAMTTPPTGYLKANGAAVSRTGYSALFAAIGTTFGAGDGSTTFNLPDLRGEFVRGYDDGRGADAGRSFGSAQAADTAPHSHYIFQDTSSDYSNLSSNKEKAPSANTSGSSSGASYNIGSAGGTANEGRTSTAGGSETRPRNVALLACIKY